MNHADELLIPINNRLEEDDFEDVSGIDGALDTLRYLTHSHTHSLTHSLPYSHVASKTIQQMIIQKDVEKRCTMNIIVFNYQ